MVEMAWLALSGAAVASLVGFAWLALAMDVHWEQVHAVAGPRRPVQKLLRALGSAALAVSFGLCFVADRPSMAVLVWVMLLAAGAAAIAFTLTWRPSVLRGAWPAGAR